MVCLFHGVNAGGEVTEWPRSWKHARMLLRTADQMEETRNVLFCLTRLNAEEVQVEMGNIKSLERLKERTTRQSKNRETHLLWFCTKWKKKVSIE